VAATDAVNRARMRMRRRERLAAGMLPPDPTAYVTVM
jgi:hypothetical protein